MKAQRHLAKTKTIELVHIGATWRMRITRASFLRPAQVHSANDKSIITAVFGQLTAERPYILQ